MGLSALVVVAVLSGAAWADTLSLDAAHAGKLAPYTFADTRRLVALVEDAAGLVEREGAKAFAEFAVRDLRDGTTDRSTSSPMISTAHASSMR